MKKFLSLFLCVLLVGMAFPGCAIGDVEQVNDSLSIWYEKSEALLNGRSFSQAMSRFSASHPGINLTFYEPDGGGGLSAEQKREKMSADLLAGKGPDLLLLQGREADLYKWARAGAFYDLNLLIAEDTDYDAGIYQQAVMDAGILNGKRFAFPLLYNICQGYSTTELLASYGLAPAKMDTLDGFLSELETAEFTEEHPFLLCASPDKGDLEYASFYYPDVFYSFPGLVDLEEKTVSLDSPAFRRMLDIKKKWYLPAEALQGRTSLDATLGAGTAALYEQQLSMDFITLSRCLKIGEGLSVPLPNESDGLTAIVSLSAMIRNNSTNRQLAWDFIKCIYSEYLPYRGESDNRLYDSASFSVPTHLTTRGLMADGARYLANTEADHLGGVPVPTDQNVKLEETLDRVDRAILFVEPYQRIWDCFEPYIQGKKDFDACKKNAEENLALYLSE